jgi:hypothetical protein
MNRVCIALCIGALSLAGCASVESFFKSPTAAPVIAVAVDLAVGTAESKGIAPADINRIAKLALAADTASTSATLATVASVVNAQIAKLKLPAADMAAATILETAIEAAIAGKINGNASVSVAQTDAAEVLNAVIAATGG